MVAPSRPVFAERRPAIGEEFIQVAYNRRMRRLLLLVLGLVLVWSPAAAAAVTRQVTIAGFAFSPNPVDVVAGDTVRWTNADSSAHNIVGDGFASPTDFGPGGSYETVFAVPGTYAYRCTLHNGMDGVVRVAAAPTAVVSEAAWPAAMLAGGVIVLIALARGRRGTRTS